MGINLLDCKGGSDRETAERVYEERPATPKGWCR